MLCLFLPGRPVLGPGGGGRLGPDGGPTGGAIARPAGDGGPPPVSVLIRADLQKSRFAFSEVLFYRIFAILLGLGTPLKSSGAS